MSLPPEVLLAKQPIYKADKHVYGYELLFRSPLEIPVTTVGEDLATSQVLVDYCASISEQVENSSHLHFINVAADFLLSEYFLPVSAERVVIELVERIEINDEIIASVRAWKEKGFHFALDDYEGDPSWEELIPLADFIKLDIQDMCIQRVQQQLESLKTKARSDCLFVAERIETEEIFEQCKQLDFDLFQGYFLARPKEVMGSTIRPGASMTMQLIKELENETVDMDEIAELVSKNPKLSFQMLKIVNSSLLNLPNPVEDLKDALIYLGTDMLRQWALLISFLSGADAHIEACKLVLARAKACELNYKQIQRTAPGRCEDTPSAAFLTGMISGADILLHVPAEGFLEQVNLSSHINNAILNGDGALGEILANMLFTEYAITHSQTGYRDLTRDLLEAYNEAAAWAEDVLKILR